MPKIPSMTSLEKVMVNFEDKPRTNTWAEHKERWSSCQLCNLCRGRSKVVLARGALPCNVLFLGESPTIAENVIGQPFVGDAGNVLNTVIGEALRLCSKPHLIRIAFTNLISCMPIDSDGKKSHEPPKESIKACSTRLNEFVELAKPKALVMVGKHSKKHALKVLQDYKFDHAVEVMHPAVLLRLDISQEPLAAQRITVILRDLFDAVIEGLD